MSKFALFCLLIGTISASISTSRADEPVTREPIVPDLHPSNPVAVPEFHLNLNTDWDSDNAWFYEMPDFVRLPGRLREIVYASGNRPLAAISGGELRDPIQPLVTTVQNPGLNRGLGSDNERVFPDAFQHASEWDTITRPPQLSIVGTVILNLRDGKVVGHVPSVAFGDDRTDALSPDGRWLLGDYVWLSPNDSTGPVSANEPVGKQQPDAESTTYAPCCAVYDTLSGHPIAATFAAPSSRIRPRY